MNILRRDAKCVFSQRARRVGSYVRQPQKAPIERAHGGIESTREVFGTLTLRSSAGSPLVVTYPLAWVEGG